MPRFSVPALESQFGQAAVTALTAAATTYIRPARFPRWVRRGLAMSNTLTAVGAAVAGDRRPARSQIAGKTDDTINLVDGRPASRAGANLVSASSAGMALVTSGLALRVDKTVEKMLVKRGVRNPRLWMAAGAAVVSLAGPWVTKAIQNSTAKLQDKAMPKPALESTLANPLGSNEQRSTSQSTQIEAGDQSRSVVSDQENGADAAQNTDH